jgi:CelD/BcsL family acetyltransferase involved in cellulose biosynthesis
MLSRVVVREIERLGELASLRRRWERLMAACPHATPFQAPGWVLPFLHTFGAEGLWALAVFGGERLVALLPLRIQRRPEGRVASCVAAGITDYHALLAEAGSAGDEARRALAAHLVWRARAGALHRCELEQLPPDEPLLALAGPSWLGAAAAPQDVCPYVSLPDTPEALDRQLPSDLGPRLARCVRRLERLAPTSFRTADASSTDQLMEALFRLHAARWEQRRLPGVITGAGLRAFHRAVARDMAAAGRLRLHALMVGEEPRAVVYGFAHHRRIYAYLAGFDPALARFSPGLVILRQVMRAAIEEGAAELDLLRGDEAYKFRLGARPRWTQRLVIGRSDAPEYAAADGTGAAAP